MLTEDEDKVFWDRHKTRFVAYWASEWLWL